MKKTILLIAAFMSMNAAFSQESDYTKSTVSIDIGQSIVGAFLKLLEKDAELTQTKLFSTPVFQAGYQYNTSKHFSIGAAASLQQFGAEVHDFNYAPDGEPPMYVDYKLLVNRINIAVKPTFYYINKSTFGLYSAARIGLTNWGLSLDGNVPGYQPEELLSGKIETKPTMQIVLIGMQASYEEGFGVHMEFAVGSPYYIAGGVHYKF